MNHPARTHKMFNGQCIYNWQVVRLLPYKQNAPSNKRLNVRAVCRPCGKEYIVPEYYILRGHSPKKHCGCLSKTIITNNPWAYRSWMMMHQRCYNTKHVAWKHYGGRGIHVCPSWHKDNPDGKGFERFIAFMGERPSLKFSIDRVANDGSYYPYRKDGIDLEEYVEGAEKQCRWATAEQQRANQREPQRRVA
jgi:hypothetical protein